MSRQRRLAIQRVLGLRYRHPDRGQPASGGQSGSRLFGNIFTTFSGSRGQKVPVAVYKIDLNYNLKPFINELMNATALVFDRAGMLYVSSRYDGFVYQVTPNGNMSVYVEGMGVATGLAFDPDGNLYVGDRSGTIFKISPVRQIFVFATWSRRLRLITWPLARWLSLRHRPTTSSFDSVYRFRHAGEVEVFYRGLGRPQGMAFDARGIVSTSPPRSAGGAKGVVRIVTSRTRALSGPGIVGSRSLRRARWSSPPPTPSTASTSASRAGQLSPLMNAEIIAVGSEMLTPQKLDTDSSSSPIN